MGGGVDLHRRAEHRPRADAHRTHVEHDTVEVHVDARAGVDVVAVVAVEWRLEVDGGIGVGQQLGHDGPVGGLVGRVGRVQPQRQLAGAPALGHQLGVGGDVQLAGQHLLFFGRHEEKETTDYADCTD